MKSPANPTLSFCCIDANINIDVRSRGTSDHTGKKQCSKDVTLERRAHAALSTVERHHQGPGLEHPVNVLRDRWGVAHIYAQNQHDLILRPGIRRRSGSTLSNGIVEALRTGPPGGGPGPVALPRDVNARLLSYRGDMEAEYESYSPDTQAILEAFTAGINAYIASRKAPGGPAFRWNFNLRDFKPEPWKPTECLNRMAAFSMTGNAFTELEHAQAAQAPGRGRGIPAVRI